MFVYDDWNLLTPILGDFFCLFYFLEWLVGCILGHEGKSAVFFRKKQNCTKKFQKLGYFLSFLKRSLCATIAHNEKPKICLWVTVDLGQDLGMRIWF